MPSKITDQWFKKSLLLIILCGILASLINFFNFRSLWLDEAMLSISIVSRTYSELLVPLEFDQVAPIGFLFVENFFSSLFNNQDWSLRIFPYLAYLASTYLIYNFNKQLFKSVNMALLAAAIFSVNSYLMYYSIEVKQYIMDVFICLLISVSALHYYKIPNTNSLIGYTLVAILSVWFSNIAVIMLFTVGLIGLYKIFWKNNTKKYIGLLPILMGALSFLVYYLFFIHEHPAREAMLIYWKQNNGFMHEEIFTWEFRYMLLSKAQTVMMLLQDIGKYWFVSLLFVAIGIFTSLKYKKVISIILLPFCIHLVLSYFKLYPFNERLILYLIPLFITLLAAGLYNSFLFLDTKGFKVSLFILLIPVLYSLSIIFKSIPIENEEIKKSLAVIDTDVDKDAALYVYYASLPAFDFYKNSYIHVSKMDTIFRGERHVRKRKESVKQLNLLPNKVWLLFSHINARKSNTESEANFIINTLLTNGYVIKHKKIFKGSSVYNLEK